LQRPADNRTSHTLAELYGNQDVAAWPQSRAAESRSRQRGAGADRRRIAARLDAPGRRTGVEHLMEGLLDLRWAAAKRGAAGAELHGPAVQAGE